MILTCENSICKRITIPSPSEKVATPNVTVEFEVPTGLRILSATPSLGGVNENVWTITSIPPGVSPTLDVCFTANNCNVAPTGKSGVITISTTADESDVTNNETTFTLEYITCDDINACVNIIGLPSEGETGQFLRAVKDPEDDSISGVWEDFDSIYTADGVISGKRTINMEVANPFVDSSIFTITTDTEAAVEPLLFDLQKLNPGGDEGPTIRLFEGAAFADSTTQRASLNPQWLILQSQYNGGIQFWQSAPQIVAYFGASGTTGTQLIFNSNNIEAGAIFGGFFGGILYTSDYSANFTDRSLVDKEYVDSRTPKIASGYFEGDTLSDGSVLIPHGLGVIPTGVTATLNTSVLLDYSPNISIFWDKVGSDATNIKLIVLDGLPEEATVSFSWMAFI